ncbi:hypothetical protein [Caenibacillus caldisaponilyticus]|uniref:hypothetical protein n=1 Tax=Caenibacillus caldisaponilyticus TaxID=1674942 RepID=UPI0009883AC3|nr:hypothetical protein [Caenibacillus caldisaponilyticus]
MQNQWNGGQITILIAVIAGFISMFFKWTDAILISQNGFTSGAFIFLIIFIYPVIQLIRHKPINKIAGLILAVIGVIAGIFYISSASVSLFGTSVNLSSTGPYVFIVASVLLAIGSLVQKKPA